MTMKNSKKKPLSLNKFIISKLNNTLGSIKGGNSVEGDNGSVNTVTTTRISQFPMICDSGIGTNTGHNCESGNTHSQECEN